MCIYICFLTYVNIYIFPLSNGLKLIMVSKRGCYNHGSWPEDQSVFGRRVPVW